MENLKQENAKLAEEKAGLEIHSQKLAEEASYAKDLAAAAAVELQHLTEEVTRLSHQNAELIGELDSIKAARSGSGVNESSSNCAVTDTSSRKLEYEQLIEYLQKELNTRYQREAMLESALSEKERVERELGKQLNEAKRHEEVLESDLENMWVIIENMRKADTQTDDIDPLRVGTSEVPMGLTSKSSFVSGGTQVCRNLNRLNSDEELSASYLNETERSQELEKLISRLKACRS